MYVLDTDVWYSEFWHLATEWITRLLLNMTLRMVEAAAAVKARDLMTDDGDWITGANNRLLADDWVEGVTRWHGLGGSSENPRRHGWTIQNCLLMSVTVRASEGWMAVSDTVVCGIWNRKWVLLLLFLLLLLLHLVLISTAVALWLQPSRIATRIWSVRGASAQHCCASWFVANDFIDRRTRTTKPWKTSKHCRCSEECVLII